MTRRVPERVKALKAIKSEKIHAEKFMAKNQAKMSAFGLPLVASRPSQLTVVALMVRICGPTGLRILNVYVDALWP